LRHLNIVSGIQFPFDQSSISSQEIDLIYNGRILLRS